MLLQKGKASGKQQKGDGATQHQQQAAALEKIIQKRKKELKKNNNIDDGIVFSNGAFVDVQESVKKPMPQFVTHKLQQVQIILQETLLCQQAMPASLVQSIEQTQEQIKQTLEQQPLQFQSFGFNPYQPMGFSCAVCNKVYKSADYLKRHILFKHEKKSKHKCDFCNKMFAGRTNLLAHLSSCKEKH